VNYAKGFKGTSLDFLTSDLPVRRLYLLDRSITDARPIENLANTLRHISFEAAPGIPLDVSRLPNLRSVAAGWKAIERSVRFGSALEAISTTRYDAKDLVPLCTHTHLRILQIKEAPDLESVAGLRSLNQLETLRLLWAVRLRDLSELHCLGATLQELRMERCRAVRSLDEIGTLVNLRVLEFGDGPEIPSLAPLSRLVGLEWAVLWGTTKVMDDDLTPLLGLPHLKVFRMQSRASYKPSVAEIQAATA
jgi:hypothetical protein